ncbi:MAG TPA: hydroxyacid dehydrogenase [Anaerovoracaceae bacterium]|nr:hydroxyacid dehydrogenase [Anaerovoracaceae bacterium]
MKLKTKVLLTQPIHAKGMEILENAVETVIVAPDDKIETIASLLDEEVTGVVVRYNVFNRYLMEKAPNLKVIARHGIGVELIDLEAAAERGILVVNTPDAATVSVAEHVVMMILALSKKMLFADRELKKGNYAVKDKYMPDDVEGKTLGLVGLGKIGREVAKRCIGLGMDVTAYDPYTDQAAFDSMGVEKAPSLEALLERSDFVSLHTPLNPDTQHLMGEAQFKRMKKSAYLINCARGQVVDEAALINCLQEKIIAGAGLDVFEKEPPGADNPLFAMDNVIVTPHSSSLTVNGKIKMATGATEQLLKVLRGETPDYIVKLK